MVEIGAGELLFRREELEVTLLVDTEQLAAVEVRAAPGWGRMPLHVHARHAEALFVFEGALELRLEDRAHLIAAETWAFVPPEVVHAFAVTGDEQARFLVLHAPGSGYGDYVRGIGAAFDQQPPPEYAIGDPGLVVVHRAGGKDGETVRDSPETGRATILVDSDELNVTEFVFPAGRRGAQLHVHHLHADAFLVVEGELSLHDRTGTTAAPAPALMLFPPNVVHGFDNDSAEPARCFNFHVPATGFTEYMRGRKPDFDQHEPPEDGGVASAVVGVRLSR